MRKLIGKFMDWVSAKNVEVNYVSRLDDLKKRGLKIGTNTIISPACKIEHNYPYLVSIGDNCVVGPNVRIIAHDSTMSNFVDEHMKLARVDIKDNVILSMDTIVLPGVTIGPNVLVAAGSVVNKDIPPNTCVGGVPARFYGKFDAFIDSIKKEIEERPVFKAVDLCQNEDEKDQDRKRRIIEAAKDGPVYLDDVESRYPIWRTKK